MTPRSAAIAATLFAVVITSPARADKKTRPVHLDSEPAGAAVYVDDRDAGPRGETPLDLALTPGEHTITLELDGYSTRVDTITVERGEPDRQSFAFTLAVAKATLVIEAAPGVADAEILIDGHEGGPAPATLRIAPGPHQVLVQHDGYRDFEQWIELEDGQRLVLRPTLEAEARAAPKPKPRAEKPRSPYGTGGAGLDIGWRRFRYQEPQTGNLRPFDADGIVLFRLEAELYPWRTRPALAAIRPLSLVLGGAFALPLTSTFPDGSTIDSYWRTAEVGLRWRFAPAPRVAVDVDGGWARLLFTFRAASQALVDQVPDVDYQALRVGARVIARLGRVEPYLGAEARTMISSGVLGERFRASSVRGWGARAGAEARWLRGRVASRVELSLARYGWDLEAEDGDAYVASGADDTYVGATITVGVSY